MKAIALAIAFVVAGLVLLIHAGIGASPFMAGCLGAFCGVSGAGAIIALGIWLDIRRTRRRIYGDK